MAMLVDDDLLNISIQKKDVDIKIKFGEPGLLRLAQYLRGLFFSDRGPTESCLVERAPLMDLA